MQLAHCESLALVQLTVAAQPSMATQLEHCVSLEPVQAALWYWPLAQVAQATQAPLLKK